MMTSRLTSKAQTTIPQAVRTALGLPVASIVRSAKIATIAAKAAATIGGLPVCDRALVHGRIVGLLPFGP